MKAFVKTVALTLVISVTALFFLHIKKWRLPEWVQP